MLAFFQNLVQLPDPIVLAILSGVTLLLGLILTQLAKALPWLAAFLGQYVDEVAVAVAGVVVTYLNNLLAQIPANWEGVATIALQLVVAILAALGALYQYRKARLIRAAKFV
jgi:ABC-type Fe3+ transport system substrate-binding protein